MTTPPASIARALMRSTAVAILTAAAMLSCLPGESPATAAADQVHDGQGRQDSPAGSRAASTGQAGAAQALPDAGVEPAKAEPMKARPAAAARKKVANGDSNHAAGEGSTAPRRPPNRDSIIDAMWPVRGPDPLPGAILPRKRIVAFYGNPLSTRMGVLGEYEPDEMLRRLDAEVAAWEAADPSMPVQPALHLIAVVAQGAPGRDGKYRLRMDSALIEKVAGWARKRDALMFLDIQVGHSTLREELPRLTPFLSRPNFHLGIDPEFSMKNGGLPGKKIGTYDAEDVNYAAAFLQDIVTKNGLPPKVLVVHRFTRKGLTNYRNIKLDPRVQIVIDMDGFGPPRLKKGTFRDYVRAEPVQFVGWKQFFKPKNDNPRTTIAEILKLWPRPVYIQYQ